jgi:drug/metabolite transporter (DMT)-like permease
MDGRAFALVVLLCLVWGVQQVFMKGVATAVAPVMQLALRFAGGWVFFGVAVLRREGARSFLDAPYRSGLLMGSLFTLEFLLVGESLRYTTAAHTVVFLYTAPIFTAIGVQFLPNERLRGVQWLGVAVAFLGIATAFAGPGARPVADLLFGDFLALLGGAAWGLSNVVLRRGRIGNASTATTVFFQVGVATPVLYLFAIGTGQSHVVFTAAAIGSLLFQTLVISILSYLVWFWLLRHYLTSRLMLMTLLTPLFGVVAGSVFLHDPIDARFAVGSMLVLAGILIVNAQLIRSLVRGSG